MAYKTKTPEWLMGRKADKYHVNEAGDTTGYQFSGTIPGGIMGLLGNMFGGRGQESSINEKPSDNPLNPLNQKVNEVSTMENPNNYNQMATNIQDDRVFDYVSGQTDELWKRFEKQGIDTSQLSKEDFINRLGEYTYNTGMAESRGEHSAANPKSTAKGKYQFIDAAVPTGRQSLYNAGVDISSIQDDPRQWSDADADLMAYSRIFPTKGSDKYLLDLARGEEGAGYNLYANIHHTDPDDIGMQENAANFFDLPPDVQLMMDERQRNSAFNY